MKMNMSERRDFKRLETLGNLLENAAVSPIGDILQTAIHIFEEIENPMVRKLAEEAMKGIRAFAARANVSDVCFSEPPKLQKEVSDIEFLQLVRIDMTTHELCYCFEMVQDAANKVGGGSSGTRFYLNGMYHYVSSLFLIDTSRKSHKGLLMGGTIIRALSPMGLSSLLEPVKDVLDQPLGDISLGETILHLRHSDLVHGDFSPERVEYIIRQTQFRNPVQQEEFAHLLWLLFHRIIILNLQISSLIASTCKDVNTVVVGYMQQQLDKNQSWTSD